MDIQGLTLLATVVIALTTVVYTIGTFLLWRTTQKSLNITTNEIKRREELNEVVYASQVYKNFREIYTAILNDEVDVEILAKTVNKDVPTLRKEYLASFLINHAYEIFLFRNKNLISENFWNKVIIDMIELFTWSFISQRWTDMKVLFPKDFQDFIDNIILQPKPQTS